MWPTSILLMWFKILPQWLEASETFLYGLLLLWCEDGDVQCVMSPIVLGLLSVALITLLIIRNFKVIRETQKWDCTDSLTLNTWGTFLRSIILLSVLQENLLSMLTMLTMLKANKLVCCVPITWVVQVNYTILLEGGGSCTTTWLQEVTNWKHSKLDHQSALTCSLLSDMWCDFTVFLSDRGYLVHCGKAERPSSVHTAVRLFYFWCVRIIFGAWEFIQSMCFHLLLRTQVKNQLEWGRQFKLYSFHLMWRTHGYRHL